MLTNYVTPEQSSPIEVSKDFIKGLGSVLTNFDKVCYDKVLLMVDNDFEELSSYCKQLSCKLNQRLSSYLQVRLPLHRGDLSPNNHWVWLSFKRNIDLLSATMIASGHVSPKETLFYLGDDESLLNASSNFYEVDKNIIQNELNCNYLILDSKRSDFVLSGVADHGVSNAWRKMAVDSLQENYSSRKDKFSAAYPNTDKVEIVDNKNVSIKGKFEDLKLFTTLSIENADVAEWNALFNFTDLELNQIKLLVNRDGPNNMDHKKLKHLLELFHFAYTLAMNPTRNMSGTIPCGWQLQYGTG